MKQRQGDLQHGWEDIKKIFFNVRNKKYTIEIKERIYNKCDNI
jgi:hypothetical protein